MRRELVVLIAALLIGSQALADEHPNVCTDGSLPKTAAFFILNIPEAEFPIKAAAEFVRLYYGSGYVAEPARLQAKEQDLFNRLARQVVIQQERSTAALAGVPPCDPVRELGLSGLELREFRALCDGDSSSVRQRQKTAGQIYQAEKAHLDYLMDSQITLVLRWTRDEDRRKKEWVNRLIQTLKEKDAVDVFIFSHSNEYWKLLAQVPLQLRSKIRLVYNAGCGNAASGADLLKLGVGAYVGHTGISMSPLFFPDFREAWLGGKPLSEAVRQGNDFVLSSKVLVPIARFLENLGEDKKLSDQESRLQTQAQLFGDPHISIFSRCWSRFASENSSIGSPEWDFNSKFKTVYNPGLPPQISAGEETAASQGQ